MTEHVHNFEDCVRLLLTPISILAREATPVKKLPVYDMWDKELKAAWVQALTQFAPVLDCAITRGWRMATT